MTVMRQGSDYHRGYNCVTKVCSSYQRKNNNSALSSLWRKCMYLFIYRKIQFLYIQGVQRILFMIRRMII